MMGALTWLFQILLCFSQYQVAFSSLSLRPSFTSSANNPLCHHDQRSALLQFKHMFTIKSSASSECASFGVPSYPKTLSWDENATDCCDWDGVTCDGLTGHVVGLDLSCSQLYGTIHPNSSLFQLSHLQRLNLAHNDFINSSIPYAFGSLASLTHLNLSFSAFSESLGDLTRIESLDISSNQLTGRIPSQLRSLTFLAVLNLSWNHLHGPIPQGLQFGTFGNGSYAGNSELCGFPLSKECEDNQTKVKPPVSQKQEGNSDLYGFTWKIVVIGYGCGMTLGFFLGSLMFLIGRPKFFVRFAEIDRNA